MFTHEYISQPLQNTEHFYFFCPNLYFFFFLGFPCFLPTEPTPEPTVPTTIDYRLPETLVPSHYDIDLRPHYYDTNPENFWFEGNVTIHFLVKYDAKVFHISGKVELSPFYNQFVHVEG